jgi:uncharacterized protein involved in outer membrane biogenesis
VLADLAPAFGAAGTGTANPKPPPGRVLPQREFDIPSLRAMNASVKVQLKRADLGSLFRQPLEPLQGDLTLDRGVLKVSNVLARAAGGRITGMVGLDANRAEPEYSADVRWGGIELEQWLRPRNPAAQTNSPTGDRPGYVSGRLGGHAQLRGRGKSTAQWLASTDGSVQAWVRDGRLSHLLQEAVGLDVAQALGVLFVGDDFMPMRCAVVKANARNGTVTSEIAIADTRDSTLFATGAVGLADERLDLTVTARPKDISPVSLRAPIRVQGTFAAPRVALEGRRLGLRLAAAAALGAINPLAALIPLFDPGDQAAANACQQTLGRLRDADGPTGARDSKAPRPERVPGPARR